MYIYRLIDIQIDGQIFKQINRQLHGQIHKYIDRQIDRSIERQIDRSTDRPKDLPVITLRPKPVILRLLQETTRKLYVDPCRSVPVNRKHHKDLSKSPEDRCKILQGSCLIIICATYQLYIQKPIPYKSASYLETGARVCQFPDPVKDEVHDLLPDGVVPPRVVVGRILLAQICIYIYIYIYTDIFMGRYIQ